MVQTSNTPLIPLTNIKDKISTRFIVKKLALLDLITSKHKINISITN